MEPKRLVILYGGRSGEYEVSLRSAASVWKNLDKAHFEIILVGITRSGRWYLQKEVPDPTVESLPLVEDEAMRVSLVPGKGLAANGKDIPVDIAFPVLHGTYGEDGTMQGLLEMADIPYVGAGVLGSALSMDKEKTKAVWHNAGLPILHYLTVRIDDLDGPLGVENVLRPARRAIGLPLIVKPCCAGSSVGVTKVTTMSDVQRALEIAFRFDTKALIEPFISAREIECSVTGNSRPEAWPPGEVVPSHEFYDYEAKYIDPHGAKIMVPARIPEDVALRVKDIAVQAYAAVEAEGMARIDFFIHRETGELYLNEINTIPGFTNISMFPMMCEAGGLLYAQLLEKLVDLGFKRHAQRKGLGFFASLEKP